MHASARTIVLLFLAACAGAPPPAPASAPEPATVPTPASLDALFLGTRTTRPLPELLQAVVLAPDESFKIVEIGRDGHTSHHVVALRGAEPLHRHDLHDLLVFVIEGEGRMLLGDEARAIAQGSIVYIPRGVVHSMQSAGSAPVRGYAVFTPAFDGKDRVPVAEPAAVPNP